MTQENPVLTQIDRKLIPAILVLMGTVNRRGMTFKFGPGDDDDKLGPDGEKIIPGPPGPGEIIYPPTIIPEEEKYIPGEIKPPPTPQPPRGEITVRMGPDDGDEPPAPPEPLNPREVEKVELPDVGTVWIVGTPDGDRILVGPDDQPPATPR